MKEIEFIKDLDKSEFDRLRVKLKTEQGELIDVLYQFESFINNEWKPIVRYDCAHGYFHRDVIYPNGTKEKQEIVIDNLRHASEYAEQDLKDRWEWYKERYLKKLKRKKK